MADQPVEEETARQLREVLEGSGEAALDGAPARSVAYRWLAHGFTDPEEVKDWLAARCFRPDLAHELERAGLTPEQAARRTTAGRGDYEDTVAYKIAQGDLTLEEARRFITSDFWND